MDFQGGIDKMKTENFENLDESEMLSSKNGPLLSLSGSTKFQATAAPGPREKEIEQLFRKVQAQLRERAAAKEDKKTEASQGRGKESETVDSLLKLLRKHSADHVPELEEELESETESELEPESIYQDPDVLDELSEDESSDVDEEDREQHTGHEDLRALKLPELRAVAKSRGLKGFSKTKKSNLVLLLRSSSC
ncbi:hypothetical protein CRYUN_Cryun20dG0086000 [Craigia yunnanensis]